MQWYLVVLVLITPYTEILLHTFFLLSLLEEKCIEPMKLDVILSGDVLEWLPANIAFGNNRNKKNPHLYQLQCVESTCTVEMAVYHIKRV